jgi:hypothetical protein
MRAGTVRFFGVVCAAVLLLVALVAFVPELQPVSAQGEVSDQPQAIRYEDVKSAADGIAFLAQFGWEVDPTPVEESHVSVPAQFDKIFTAYNELQRAQGLDLCAYSGRTVQRYTFRVTNYEGYEGSVLANLLVFRGRVIGGDICAADQQGFLHGFQKNT